MRYFLRAVRRVKSFNSKTAHQFAHHTRRQLNRVRDAISPFRGSESGGVLITFTLILPVMIMVVGMAIDYALLVSQESKLQHAADSAALAAASEYNVVNSYDNSNEQLAAVAKSSAAANLQGKGSDFGISVIVDDETATVTVELTQAADKAFLGSHAFTNGTIKVNAAAQVIGQMPVCVIGLADHAGGTISLDSNARITAENCAVYSNSKSTSGLSSKSNAVLHAGLICSAGGSVGGKANFKPEPLTDCPVIEDPLRDRPAPKAGSCKANDLEIIDKVVTLSPGTYCGGIKIDGNAKVYMRPGIYVIKDGPLNVDSNAELEGEYVGIYLVGSKSTFRFASNAELDLSAPKDGPLAGLLFFEDRNAPKLRRHDILSNYAHNLLGTIYLPQGRLVVDADNEIADQSAYTAIIVRQLELYAGPNLVLNTDYSATDIPVPDGIVGLGQAVRLTQ